ATGSLTINLLGFVRGTVGFTYETKTVTVNLPGGGTLAGATLSTVSLTVINLFVGQPGGVGVQVGAGSLTIAQISKSGDPRSWLAVNASLSNASFVGVDGLTLTINSLTVQVNRAAGTGATPLDWSANGSPGGIGFTGG